MGANRFHPFPVPVLGGPGRALRPAPPRLPRPAPPRPVQSSPRARNPEERFHGSPGAGRGRVGSRDGSAWPAQPRRFLPARVCPARAVSLHTWCPVVLPALPATPPPAAMAPGQLGEPRAEPPVPAKPWFPPDLAGRRAGGPALPPCISAIPGGFV